MSKTLRSSLGLADEHTVAGYAVDTAHPERKLVVEILADGEPVAEVRADKFSPALAVDGADDDAANHGFVHALPDRLTASARVISARLANLKSAVGKPITLGGAAKADPLLTAAGAVEAVKGLMVTGWVRAAPGTAMLLNAVTSGEEVAATIARTWSSRTIGGEERPVLDFKLMLPPALADGRPHMIAIMTTLGAPLAGSPVRFQGTIRPKT